MNKQLKIEESSIISPADILSSISYPTFVINKSFKFYFANNAAENLFRTSLSSLKNQYLTDYLPKDGTIISLIDQVFKNNSAVSEHGLKFDTPRTGLRDISIFVSPLQEQQNYIVISLQEHTRAQKIGRQLESRSSVRSIMAMGQLLAHEIKNPLSGIRGAAQLLEADINDDNIELTRLICNEADRIVSLVDRMNLFVDHGQIDRQGVNIHSILSHVRLLSQNGFGSHINYIQKYDPSLPLVYGNRDQLIQVFLNLFKNSAESIRTNEGEIIISTSFEPGIRVKNSNNTNSLELPLVVTIKDNGVGIPEEIKEHLFEPFISTKVNGSGLGLPLIAKIINDHGGIVEFDSDTTGTVFRVMLPIIIEK